MEKGHFICKREKTFQNRFEQSELLVRTILAVNQLTIYHAVPIWYHQVQKMHPGEPDFELDVSVNDVTTLVQLVTAGLAAVTLERCATNRPP